MAKVWMLTASLAGCDGRADGLARGVGEAPEGSAPAVDGSGEATIGAEPGVDPPGVGDAPAEPTSLLRFDGAPPTNLLIVSLDTTRRDYVGRYSGSGNTPNLDEVLAQGVVLDDHRSCSSWTGPSMTCIVTGVTPLELDFWPWSTDDAIAHADPELPTLAGQLQFQRGFATSFVSANPVFGDELHFVRGFETVSRLYWYPADFVTDEALTLAGDLLAQPAPWYLHVHYVDPHADYCGADAYVDWEDYVDLGEDLCTSMYELADQSWASQTPEWQDAFATDLSERYDAEIEFWDVEFGRLWDELGAMGALDDALVLFVTDHGEQLMERGDLGHGHTLGSEENRAVAAFWAKNLVPQVWTGATVHQDLAATLHDYFDVVPPVASIGTVVGQAPPDRVTRSMLYWAPSGARLAVVQGDKQLTYDFWGSKHFHDLALDPAGLVDYYDPADPDVVSLWGPMQAFVDELVARWPSAGVPVDPGP